MSVLHLYWKTESRSAIQEISYFERNSKNTNSSVIHSVNDWAMDDWRIIASFRSIQTESDAYPTSYRGIVELQLSEGKVSN
jgi:hypothetical protein